MIMTQYIDKSAVVAEIKRRLDYYKRNPLLVNAEYCIDEDIAILRVLNHFEVKEVDLDEEIKRFVKSEEFQKSAGTIKVTNLLAKHFFELGLKVQKGE